MKYIKNGVLKDEKIIEAIKGAANDYENGAIIEAKDALIEVIEAITEFEREG